MSVVAVVVVAVVVAAAAVCFCDFLLVDSLIQMLPFLSVLCFMLRVVVDFAAYVHTLTIRKQRWQHLEHQ